MDLAVVQQHFAAADQDRDGAISGAEAVQFFKRSGLPTSVLRQARIKGSIPRRCSGVREKNAYAVPLPSFAFSPYLGRCLVPTPICQNRGAQIVHLSVCAGLGHGLWRGSQAQSGPVYKCAAPHISGSGASKLAYEPASWVFCMPA